MFERVSVSEENRERYVPEASFGEWRVIPEIDPMHNTDDLIQAR